MTAVLVLVGVAALGCESCGTAGGPSEDLQLRWANAACEPHEGVADLSNYYSDDEPANVRCNDGQGFVPDFDGPLPSQQAKPGTELERN